LRGRNHHPRGKRWRAGEGSIYSTSFIMRFFGTSIPGMRITGGILLTGIGMNKARLAPV